MKRLCVYPDNHWRMRVDIPYSMGVRHDDLFMLCGQADLQGEGEVRNSGDLYAQTASAIDHIQSIVEAMDCRVRDVSKLVVYYIPGVDFDINHYETWFADRVNTPVLPVITFVPLRHFFYPGVMVEIDAYGIVSPTERVAMASATGPFSQAVKQGRFTHVGGLLAEDSAGHVVESDDVVAQSHYVLEKLDSVLEFVGAGKEDIVKINNWYVGGGAAHEWAKSAQVRVGYYPEPGPVATGLPLTSLKRPGLMIQTDCWIMLDEDGESLPKRHSWPEGHWDWPIHLPFKHGLRCDNMVFTGGQVSMNSAGEVVDLHDMKIQAATSMRNNVSVLELLGATMADVVKVNAFYAGSDDPDALHDNMKIRSSFFSKPGPASTGIPLDALAYEGMMTEFELVAMLEQ